MLAVRIVINDYRGHAPQVQLSRALAARGHDVLHLYSSDVQTPKADLSRHSDDPRNLTIEGLSLRSSRSATSFFGRRMQEARFGRLVARKILKFAPDVVMACNNPLDVQRHIQRACTREKIVFVYWLQQFCAVEMDDVLKDRPAIFEALVGTYYHSLERALLQRSDAIVPVNYDILTILADQWDVYQRQCMVVYNWAPLDNVKPGSKDNPWSRKVGITKSKVVLYTGGLGRMEEPALLIRLAEQLRQRQDVQVVVISEGAGAEKIAAEAKSRKLDNLRVMPFQPYDEFSDVLASADVLFAMVGENAAGLFVPSKLMSYFCAGRPIVLAAPWQSLAARQVQESGAGCVVAPLEYLQISNAILTFLDDAKSSLEAGDKGRAYAERTFDISSITDRFEQFFERLRSGPARRRLASPQFAGKAS